MKSFCISIMTIAVFIIFQIIIKLLNISFNSVNEIIFEFSLFIISLNSFLSIITSLFCISISVTLFSCLIICNLFNHIIQLLTNLVFEVSSFYKIIIYLFSNTFPRLSISILRAIRHN